MTALAGRVTVAPTVFAPDASTALPEPGGTLQPLLPEGKKCGPKPLWTQTSSFSRQCRTCRRHGRQTGHRNKPPLSDHRFPEGRTGPGKVQQKAKPGPSKYIGKKRRGRLEPHPVRSASHKERVTPAGSAPGKPGNRCREHTLTRATGSGPPSRGRTEAEPVPADRVRPWEGRDAPG